MATIQKAAGFYIQHKEHVDIALDAIEFAERVITLLTC